jgi:hypothetical protein
MHGIKIKEDLISLKERLDKIEDEFKQEIEELNQKMEYYENLDREAERIIKENNHFVVLNVSGKKFTTKVGTLLSVKDSFFYHLVLSKKIDYINEEIYLDTEPEIFEIILHFLRSKNLYMSLYDNETRKKIINDFNYYEIHKAPELSNIILSEEIPIIKIENTDPYIIYNYNSIENLTNTDFHKGVACCPNGAITFELEEETEIYSIYMKALNSSGWGENAHIKLSKDKINWEYIGEVPNTYHNNIISISVDMIIAKYIQITHNNYFGFGYFVVKGNRKLV